MSQKINPIESRPVAVSGSAASARTRDVGKENRAAVEDPRATAGGSVRITDGARQLAALEKAIAQIPVVDPRRVSQTVEALERGRYRIDAVKVADRLLRSEAELAEARRRDA
ncbi:MAG: flagellar biosynthesis anti-sigma factor FlgM [Steroidobacteraceae bacterium]|nr:flagellar biosynthesis anti-sigma factor FlgM [Steroidobacteraceae bacterium]MDW8258835.1 flagellar biosynthesis anti-sigma factor FlgM [Gammaproteobacteria bacterium]